MAQVDFEAPAIDKPYPLVRHPLLQPNAPKYQHEAMAQSA